MIDQPRRALAWMAGSALGFSIMAAFVKHLAPSIPHFELVFARSFVNLLLVFAFMKWAGESLLSSGKGDRPLLLFRGLAGFGGIACLFYSVSHLPLPVAMLLSWCSPIFVILFSTVLLKERIRPQSFLWIVVSLAGLVLLLRPDLSGQSVALPLKPVLIGIFGAACAGLAYVAVRAATARVTVNTITLHLTGVAALISAPLAFADWVMPTSLEAGELILMGITAGVAQYAMTQGYRYAPAGLVSTMSLLNAVFSAILGWLLFGETLGHLQWIGMILVASGVALVTLSSSKLGNFSTGLAK